MWDSMKHSTSKRITGFGVTAILAVLVLTAAAQDAKPPESAKSLVSTSEDCRKDLRRMQSECDYRAIVTWERENDRIVVGAVGHRRNVYDRHLPP